MDNKEELKRYIRARIEEITSPVGFAYGYMTYYGADERLSELGTLARCMGLWDVAEAITNARRPIKEKIDEHYRHRGFGLV